MITNTSSSTVNEVRVSGLTLSVCKMGEAGAGRRDMVSTGPLALGFWDFFQKK